MKIKYIITLMLVTLITPIYGEIRVFTDTQGRTIEGTLLNFESDVVTIKRKDGQVFTIPLANFCINDRQYIAKIADEDNGIKHDANSKPTEEQSGPTEIFRLINFKIPKTSEQVEIIKSIAKFHEVVITPDIQKKISANAAARKSIYESIELLGITGVGVRVKGDINATNEYIVSNLKAGPIWFNTKSGVNIASGFILGYNNVLKEYTLWVARDQTVIKLKFADFNEKVNSLSFYKKSN